MTRYVGPGRLRKDTRARQPRWVLDWSNGTRRQRRTLSTDKRTAEQLHLELLRQRDLQRGGLNSGQETLLSDLVATYLADLATRSSSRHVVNVRAGLDYTLAALPAQRLCDLKPVMVIEYRGALLRAGLSVRSANLAVDRLRACLNWCVRLDLIATNPIGHTPRLKETEATARYRRRALSESEIVRFLTASEEDDQLCATRRANGQTYRGNKRTPRIPQTPLWRALIETGARWGELTRCTWTDLDLHGRVLVLRAAHTKAGKARSIPLLDGLVGDLVRLRALHAQVYGRSVEANDRVFLAPGGVPWARPTTNPMRIFDRVLERAGIPRVNAQGRKLDIHSLRTTCGSRMARSGVGDRAHAAAPRAQLDHADRTPLHGPGPRGHSGSDAGRAGNREREEGRRMKPGDRVVIAFNPHDESAGDIVGTVVAFRPGAGFMGCDIVDVRYVHPRDGTEHELPFAAANLDPGDGAVLLARAQRHEQQAAMLRRMAEELAG